MSDIIKSLKIKDANVGKVLTVDDNGRAIQSNVNISDVAQISDVNSASSTLDTKINTLRTETETKTQSLDQDISGLNTRVTNLETQVEAIGNAIVSINGEQV